MSKLSIIAKLSADPSRIDEFETTLAALIVAADEEPGLEIYSAHRDQSESGTYWFFEVYTSAADFEVHGKGELMKAAMGALGGFLTARPEVFELDPVTAKGLTI